MGNIIKMNFLGKILKIYLTTLDKLIHFHVISAVIDLGLPVVNGMLHRLPALVLAMGGINPQKASNSVSNRQWF